MVELTPELKAELQAAIDESEELKRTNPAEYERGRKASEPIRKALERMKKRTK